MCIDNLFWFIIFPIKIAVLFFQNSTGALLETLEKIVADYANKIKINKQKKKNSKTTIFFRILNSNTPFRIINIYIKKNMGISIQLYAKKYVKYLWELFALKH